MAWEDIAAIVFVCVTVNHLGLVSAIERTIHHSLPILNCPKCLTFWATIVYGLVCCDVIATPAATVPASSLAGIAAALPRLLAISLLAAYLALWLELTEGCIDLIYMKLYEKIYPPTDDHATAPAADGGHT